MEEKEPNRAEKLIYSVWGEERIMKIMNVIRTRVPEWLQILPLSILMNITGIAILAKEAAKRIRERKSRKEKGGPDKK